MIEDQIRLVSWCFTGNMRDFLLTKFYFAKNITSLQDFSSFNFRAPAIQNAIEGQQLILNEKIIKMH